MKKEEIELKAKAYAETFRYKVEDMGWRDDIVRHFTAGYQSALSEVERVREGVEVEVVEQLVQVGTLNKRWGLNGYKVAEIGHPVFERSGNYWIVLEGESTNLKPVEVPFRKEALKNAINLTPNAADSVK